MTSMLETLAAPVHSPEKNVVLKTIEQSHGKISVADVATKTGLPVLKTSALLNQIAYETGGHITVGTAGSIVYEFAGNIQGAYLARSSKNTFLRVWRILYNGAAYLARMFSLLMFFVIRVSFGIMLVAAIAVVVVLVIAVVVALLSRLMGDSDSRSDDFDLGAILGGIGRIFRYWAFDWLWDWWLWGRYIRWDPAPSYDRQISGSAAQAKDKENFLDKCFSFLFGDGDPNPAFLEKQWQMLALAIKANNGVVTAEQLAPYVDSQHKNEDWLLPIMVQFNGNCDVSESGNIIYSFPSFQQRLAPAAAASNHDSNSVENADLHSVFQNYLKTKQSSQANRNAIAGLEPFLKENLWQFSHVKGGNRSTIIAFAVFITVGSLWLLSMTALFPFIVYFIPLLVAIAIYGAMFLIVPAIRYLIIQQKNAEIEKRNEIRQQAALKLQNAGPELAQKLGEAKQLRAKVLSESVQETVAYSTEEDFLEQEFDDK